MMKLKTALRNIKDSQPVLYVRRHPIRTALLLSTIPFLLLHSPKQTKETPPPRQVTPQELLLERTHAAFDTVFSRKCPINAMAVLQEIEAAKDSLMHISIPNSKMNALMIAEMKDGVLANRQTIICERPKPGESKLTLDGRFLVERKGKDQDPGGMFSEIFIHPFSFSVPLDSAFNSLQQKGAFIANENELSIFLESKKVKLKRFLATDGSTVKLVKKGGEVRVYAMDQPGENSQNFVVLAAKVHANSKKFGSRFYIVSPYSSLLMSGGIANAALDYLMQADSQARAAIQAYSKNKEVTAMLAKVPPKVNVLISLVESIGPENLVDQEKFENALSRFLYHLFAHRESSKFLTSSSVGASGLFQIMPGTERLMLKKYKNEPLAIFNAWAKKNNYSALSYLNKENRLGNIMYSSIFGFFHHIEVLSVLELKLSAAQRNARKEGKDPSFYSRDRLLYSSETQTAMAIALGYNGGVGNAYSKMIRASISNPSIPWEVTVFRNGVENLALLARKLENLGYGVKTYAIANNFPHFPESLLSVVRVSPISCFNMRCPVSSKIISTKPKNKPPNPGGKKSKQHHGSKQNQKHFQDKKQDAAPLKGKHRHL